MTDSPTILRGLLDYLEYQRERGVRALDLSVETATLLRSIRPQQPARPTTPTPDPAPFSAAVREAPPVRGGLVTVRGTTLEEIAEQIRSCTACPLSRSRKQAVPGEGNGECPDVLFVGDGPSVEENEQGCSFVGEAGALLDRMITAGMGYRREEVFIANVVKCRPPGNRVPSEQEMQACLPYLRAQIHRVRPKLIIALGKTAIEGLLGQKVAITRFRGTWCEFEGIPVMPTYHPAYLLRSPDRKKETWEDLKAVLARLGRKEKGKG